MSGTSDPSNREMLDRLTAELRCLRPDVREPEFKNWRAEVSAAMSELFGPGHRMTVALRDVNFSPRFEQGRTRAMALLRAASSLVVSAPSEFPTAAARPAAASATPVPASVFDDEPTQITVPDETAAADSEPPAAVEPVADATVDPEPVVAEPAPAEPVAAEPISCEPAPEESADDEPVAAEPADEEPVAPPQWPALTDWPAPAADAAEMPDDGPGAETLEPESIAAATEMPDDHEADRLLSASDEDAFMQLLLAAEARPKLEAMHEAYETVGPLPDADEPAPDTVEPKRGTFLRKIALKRGRSRVLPALPSEPEAEPEAEPAPALVADWMDDAESEIPAPGVFASQWPEEAGSPEVAAEPFSGNEPAADPEIDLVIEEAVEAEPEPAPGPDLIEEPADAAPVVAHAKAAPRKRAPRRSRHRLKRLRVPVFALLAALGVGMWLWMFGGWSTMYALGASFGSDTTLTLPAGATPNPSGNARVVDAADDPRSDYIVQVVRAGIVQLSVTAAGEVSFMPAKLVARGEFLVWLDRVQRIPVGSREVPDTLYYDLDRRLRVLAIDAYQQRIVLDWPGENTKIAFSAGKSIVARDAEAWAARLVLRLLPSTTLASALGVTQAQAVDLRARISSLKTQELTLIVQGFALRPETGWAKEQSITRSEAAEFLMRLKAVFEKYQPLATS